MNRLPCKNCLCLPICLDKYNVSSDFKWVAIQGLCLECSLLANYIYRDSDISLSLELKFQSDVEEYFDNVRGTMDE